MVVTGVNPRQPKNQKGVYIMENIINKIKEYFTENEEIFNSAFEELNVYNGYAQDDIWYDMDMLDEFLSGNDATDILLLAYNGYDTSYTVDASGQKQYGEFNPNADYFRFNGYGNLVSSWYKDYTDYIDRHTVLEMLDNRDEIDTIRENSELSEMFNELERDVDMEAQDE